MFTRAILPLVLLTAACRAITQPLCSSVLGEGWVEHRRAASTLVVTLPAGRLYESVSEHDVLGHRLHVEGLTRVEVGSIN